MQLGWLEPKAQGSKGQEVSRRVPGSEVCGNGRGRRVRGEEGRKAEVKAEEFLGWETWNALGLGERGKNRHMGRFKGRKKRPG